MKGHHARQRHQIRGEEDDGGRREVAVGGGSGRTGGTRGYGFTSEPAYGRTWARVPMRLVVMMKSTMSPGITCIWPVRACGP